MPEASPLLLLKSITLALQDPNLDDILRFISKDEEKALAKFLATLLINQREANVAILLDKISKKRRSFEYVKGIHDKLCRERKQTLETHIAYLILGTLIQLTK